jgi:hypothetical protein
VARAIGGVVAGFVIAFVVVFAVELVGMQIFPQPEGMDPLNADSVRQHLADIHPGSFAMVIIAWTLAAFFGPVVTRRIAGNSPKWPAIVVVVLFATACAFNLVTVPSPTWMIPTAVVLVGAASMLGLRSRMLSHA